MPAESNIAQPNRTFLFSKYGNTKKNDKDGNTSQKILLESSAILPTSFVSKYNQIIARNETKGIEAKTPARIPFFLAISDISTTNALEMTTLIT